MVWTYALDDGPVQCWDATANPLMPNDLSDYLEDESILLNFHNSYFDRTVLWHCGYRFPIERFRDTMVKAMAHSLPGALEKVGDILGLDEDKKKLKRGRELIQLFCKPRPKNMKLRRATRETHPSEWEEFLAYAKADIEAMRAADKKLPNWNYRGGELALWHRDQAINSRGVAVDIDLARAAIRASDRAQRHLARQTQDLTKGEVVAATQRDKLLAHILESYDIQVPDLKTSTVEKILETSPDLPGPLRDLLLVRLQASKTSSSKYKRLVNAVSSDGRLRGLLQFCGATRTGRWAGRTFQPQNLPRPKLKQKAIDFGIATMKADVEDLFHENVMELCASAIRGCIVAPHDKKLVVADLSNIEGRGLAWLAGEKWKLKAFAEFDTVIGYDENNKKIRAGHDLYALAYAKSFGITAEAVMENHEHGDGSMRQVGKVQELALGYQGGVGAFLTFALAYNIDLEAMAAKAIDNIPPETLAEAREFLEWMRKQGKDTMGLSETAFLVCDSFKRLWREAHPNIAAWWKELEDAARRAILSPGVSVPARTVTFRRDGQWLRCRLPSGRYLCYPMPQVDEGGKISYMGVNQYSRKWCRLMTYGGKVAENITQAYARDIMAANMPSIEAAGYGIVLTVHDEVITEAPDSDEYNAEGLSALLAAVPRWAPGIPLAAAGFESTRYKKD